MTRMTRNIVTMMLSAVFVISFLFGTGVEGLFEFKTEPVHPSRAELRTLRAISKANYDLAVEMGVNSIDNLQNLENNLSSRGINVQNGSISHKQLIETHPDEKAQQTNSLARKILKSSLYIYNTECIQKGVSRESCAQFLSTKSIPEGTKGLMDECLDFFSTHKDGNNVFRRLLPSNYKDGFYQMEDKLPSPREISNSALHGTVASSNDGNNHEDSHSKNLALVQWTQFIEHDLSKPVASSSQDGQQIECCDADNYAHIPRNLHPDCAPLIGVNLFSKYGKETCLNYVRSALSIEKCTFGPAQQLNQATGYLDLSQLYGFTRRSQSSMRTFSNGKLKSSNGGLLPLAEGDKRNLYCALKSDANETCFMAGDTRVNSNPYSIILYTIFLRSHNQFAEEIKTRNPDWTDETMFRAAKKLNVQLYREIVFEEWLPVVLGQKISASINAEPILRRANNLRDLEVSNEFAVAAIRFYFSMMPNVLQRMPSPMNNEINSEDAMSKLSASALFELMEASFRSEALDQPSKLNEFLASLLNQRALRMDATYAGDLIEEFTKARVPSRPNVLAFDIQRGRDHGLQGYVKYLEQCEGRPITTWDDLNHYIAPAEITKLKSVYEHVSNVDLIVGGISEIPANGSTVGPTFTCILGEQFSKIRQWHHNLVADPVSFESKLKKVTAAKLMCANSGLKEVPKNIFYIASNTNPLVPCDELLKSSN
ncbi:peroxidase [Episyrphus balteatus]|uniref:peroxidase n=1 Tax=Episyrphus balteatus TaxID=286459 RepID=UPI002485FF0D|nr:peroxidase [Episyrphus balteatus]